ncbi:uncharacterized protein BDZ83DRAFT_15049 [Colletotrichum acutatum]|uniref:Uncharacterized protein n=1 Tax=Glomerella acutata TaxID=27357 RepID=A0AAD8XLU2_GLOAC|nr:uncharacterized protein BDZ83DRAFT_15049 [Colletotrichum acutatum]KAK1729702.1 hypothetical protein BDZ83DRAFT_15049 [Colletotrichum acutatum]
MASPKTPPVSDDTHTPPAKIDGHRERLWLFAIASPHPAKHTHRALHLTAVERATSPYLRAYMATVRRLQLLEAIDKGNSVQQTAALLIQSKMCDRHTQIDNPGRARGPDPPPLVVGRAHARVPEPAPPSHCMRSTARRTARDACQFFLDQDGAFHSCAAQGTSRKRAFMPLSISLEGDGSVCVSLGRVSTARQG